MAWAKNRALLRFISIVGAFFDTWAMQYSLHKQLECLDQFVEETQNIQVDLEGRVQYLTSSTQQFRADHLQDLLHKFGLS